MTAADHRAPALLAWEIYPETGEQGCFVFAADRRAAAPNRWQRRLLHNRGHRRHCTSVPDARHVPAPSIAGSSTA